MRRHRQHEHGFAQSGHPARSCSMLAGQSAGTALAWARRAGATHARHWRTAGLRPGGALQHSNRQGLLRQTRSKARTIVANAGEAYGALYDDDHAAIVGLGDGCGSVSELARPALSTNPRFPQQLDDAARTLRDYADSNESIAERLHLATLAPPEQSETQLDNVTPHAVTEELRSRRGGGASPRRSEPPRGSAPPRPRPRRWVWPKLAAPAARSRCTP